MENSLNDRQKKEKVDIQMQEKKKLGPLEELIYKPHRVDRLSDLTKEELNQYINLDINALYKTKMNIKTIQVAKATKEFLISNKEIIFDKLKIKEEADYER